MAGTNNIIVYYTNGDPVGSPTRTLLVSVNGGPTQSRDFQPTGSDWNTVASTTIALTGFKVGNTNTVRFSGSATASAPDLDWFEVINGGAAATTPSTSCAAGTTVALKAFASGKYASARGEANGNVQAQSAVIGAWETFDIVDAGGGYVALRSHLNNLYVAAEITADAPLRARSSTIGTWEKFKFERQTDGYYAIRSNANGKFVAATQSVTNAPLRATSSTVSTSLTSWEKFQCE
jgi:hypothetical protein